jgi:hypothetical protein
MSLLGGGVEPYLTTTKNGSFPCILFSIRILVSEDGDLDEEEENAASSVTDQPPVVFTVEGCGIFYRHPFFVSRIWSGLSCLNYMFGKFFHAFNQILNIFSTL